MTNSKRWAVRNPCCEFKRIAVKRAPNVDSHVVKKPCGRPPSNKTWNFETGVWEDASNDSYGHDAKWMQRMSFAALCKNYEKEAGESNDILFLDTASGSMTELLLHFFREDQLYPCNKDASQTDAIRRRYPKVHIQNGMIEDIHLKKQWLGVFFDMEETWCERDSPGQPWKRDKIPNFNKAIVNAVTLSAHAMVGGAEQHAVELQKLIEEKGGRTPSLTSACDGKSGKMTMVFGIGIFERDPQQEAEDYLFCHLKVPRWHFQGEKWYKSYDWSMYALDYEDKLSATVVGVREGRLKVRFMNKYGFMFKDDDDWEPTVKDIKHMLAKN